MVESTQHKISRVRVPRVHITYDVETLGAIIIKELPCIIGIIGHYSGENTKIKAYEMRKFISFNAESFAELFEAFAPEINILYQIGDTQDSFLYIFKSINDFEPNNILKNIPALNEIYTKQQRISELLLNVSNSSKKMQEFIKYLKGEEISENLKELFSYGKVSPDDNIIHALTNQIYDLNKILHTNLDLILHNSKFQQLESSWRGLLYLLKNTEVGESIKLKVFNATKKEVFSDLGNALEFDQSKLFYKLYEEEFGTYGGNPYTALVCDYFIDKSNDDFEFLSLLSKVVSCAHLPTILGVNSSMFGIDSFEDFFEIRSVSNIFDSPEYIAFNSFRTMPDSKYIGLVMPKFSGRLPYQNTPGIFYNETCIKHNDYLWINSVYAFAARVTEAFAKYGWTAAIIGTQTGGMVVDLPTAVYKTDEGELIIKCPTETSLTERKEKELSDKGFIALNHCKDTNYAVFFGCASANLPLKYDKLDATNNAKISAQISYMLIASRFAHYLKCILRDKVGTFTTLSSITEYLNRWISRYVLLTISDDDEIKAKYPLQSASVIVQEISTGIYHAIVYIKPHFQLDSIEVSVRLVAKIPEVK